VYFLIKPNKNLKLYKLVKIENNLKWENVPKRVRFRISLDLTFFAAALKASLWLISGFPALIRWISSLKIKSYFVKVIYNHIQQQKILSSKSHH